MMQFSNGPFNQDINLEKEFLRIRDYYKITTVIETGTYHGITTKWLSQNFLKVFSIEIDSENYKKAKKNLAGILNIKLYLGDSSIVLKKVLRKVSNDSIVFLDAHWYTNPVLKELDSIKKSQKMPILIIHDFRVPGKDHLGYDKYPEQNITYEWEWIKDKIDGIFGEDNYSYYYNDEAAGAKRGCVFIVPIKKKPVSKLKGFLLRFKV